MTVREIRNITGLSQQAFGDKYQIPKRTIQSWEIGDRIPPAYVLNLLERVVVEDFTKGTAKRILRDAGLK